MKEYLYQILLFLFGLLWTAEPLVAKERPSLRLEIDTPAILIGEQTTARLILTGEGEIPRFQWPVYYDTLTAGVEIIEQSELDTLIDKKGDQYSIQRSYLITSFDSGFYSFSNVRISIFQDEDTLPIAAPAVQLKVFTLTVNTEDEIVDIAGPLPFSLRFKDFLPYILGVLVLVALILLILYIRKKQSRGESILRIFSKPPVPPYIRAMEELEILRRKKLWQEGKVKVYHSELSEILRTYVEGRFNIQALEMVSAEILDALGALPALDSHLPTLRYAMEVADLVKFAKHQPLPDENEKCFREVRTFVEATRPLSEIQTERHTEGLKKQNKEEGK